MKNPEKVDMVIFRENTEDVYVGIEWAANTPEARQVIGFLQEKMGVSVPEGAAIGIKPISEKNSKRLIAKAIAYALENDYPSVTLMHKGNIMKYTEGAFRTWGYEIAEERFGNQTITEEALYAAHGGQRPRDKIVIKDRLADILFQQVLLRPDEFHVIAAPNLNGDYISDALAAQVGGLGLAPGANIGDTCAVFEATHGTAPKYAGLDKVNPCSLILSGAMLFDYIGWKEASGLVRRCLAAAVKCGRVTYDLARLISGAREVSCSGFAQSITDHIARS
jgi:isocitrate dehydrogenase